MKLNESKLLILLTSVILGFLLASQISFGKLSPREVLTLQNYQQVTSEIKKVTGEINTLSEQKSALENKLQEYKYSGQSSSQSIDKLEEELKEYELYAGVTDIKGPGIAISLSDSILSDNTASREILDQSYLVHDFDVLRIVWDLKNAGAEAISINGQRIIQSTEIYCNGPVIYINGSKYVPPYKINAIGDPDNLSSFILNKDTSCYSEFLDRGLNVSLVKKDNIEIPKFDGNLYPPHVSPAKE